MLIMIIMSWSSSRQLQYTLASSFAPANRICRHRSLPREPNPTQVELPSVFDFFERLQVIELLLEVDHFQSLALPPRPTFTAEQRLA
jgi:hypothetical protein